MIWQKKQLGDFYKIPAKDWDFKELLEHCYKEVQKILNFQKGHAQQDKALRGWIAYYTELGRICKFKLTKGH